MSHSTSELLAKADGAFLRNYRQPAMVLSHGQGCQVWDTDGRRYLDLYGGIAVSALGHNHPDLVAAIATQAGRFIHTANYFFNDRGIELAAELTRRAGLERVFLCNSGTEAIEAALKLSRKYFHTQGQAQRRGIVATWSAFHGRSMGAVSLTGQPKYWEGFGAPIPDVSHVPYGDLGAMEKRLSDQTAAVFVEPIQGEGGVLPAPEGYLRGLRTLCTERGVLLAMDEIQTGIGRTGTFLACEHDGVVPDIVCLAKGIAGGVPMGALLVREHLADALPPGSHGSTFGGNPLAAAAALAVLRVIDRDKLLENVIARGEQLIAGLQGLARKFPTVAVGARGRGLLCGLIVSDTVDIKRVLTGLRDQGVLASQAGEKVVRFVPPLIVTAAEIQEGLTVLETVLAAIAKGG